MAVHKESFWNRNDAQVIGAIHSGAEIGHHTEVIILMNLEEEIVALPDIAEILPGYGIDLLGSLKDIK